MKKLIFLILPALFMLMSFSNAPSEDNNATETVQATEINWMTLQEAEALNKENPKKIFIDFYTDWCGWCKKMDQATFTNEQVITKMNENFYAVKFNAETKETITFNGKDYEFVAMGRNGTNKIAYELGSTNGRLGYPTVVVLDENLEKLQSFPGYKEVAAMKDLLNYYGDNHYKTKNWQQYQLEMNPASGK